MKDGDRDDRSRAMRLMEALSGADGEFLERSGEDTGGAAPRPLWRRAGSVAAAACLVLVAGASWGGYRLSQVYMGSSGGFSKGAMQEQLVAGASGEDAFGAALNQAEAADGKGAPEKEGISVIKDAMAEENAAAEEGAATEENAMAEENAAAVNGISAGTGTDSAKSEGAGSDVRTEASQVLQAEKLTEAQARDDAEFGGYVPEALPQGYVFGFASRDADEGRLTLCWSRGTDSILLSLSRPAEVPVPVDIAQKEAYDLRLYQVPYGLMMPAEMYLESFQDPVFAAEDFTLEAVESRMMSYQDQKDTDTPRGNFGILYPDGTLVHFDGRGTAEEIWEMFCSMAEPPCR